MNAYIVADREALARLAYRLRDRREVHVTRLGTRAVVTAPAELLQLATLGLAVHRVDDTTHAAACAAWL